MIGALPGWSKPPVWLPIYDQASSNYVPVDQDEGPIIAQDVIHCNHRDALTDLVHKGRDVERRVLAEAVRLHTGDRVLVYKNKTIVF